MKKIVTALALSLSLISASYSQEQLIAGWGFNYPSSFGAFDNDGDGLVDTTMPGVSLLGADSSAFFTYGSQTTGGLVNEANLSANTVLPDGLTTFGGTLGWQIGAADAGETLAFNVDLTGWENIGFSFAHQATAFGDGFDVLVDFGTGNQTVSLGLAEGVADFNNITSLSNVSNAQISLTFSGFDGVEVAALDNFQITGTVVPEPSTYAAIFGVFALVFVAYRRRR